MSERGAQRLVRHALRTLVKQGHPEALQLLGAAAPVVELVALELAPAQIKIGETVTLAVTLRSTAATPQQLVVDYVVEMPGMRGKPRVKVFKLRSQPLGPGETLRLVKRHSFAPVSVRPIYPGGHRIALQVNGVVLGALTVDVAGVK
jgi:hypothetical protein